MKPKMKMKKMKKNEKKSIKFEKFEKSSDDDDISKAKVEALTKEVGRLKLLMLDNKKKVASRGLCFGCFASDHQLKDCPKNKPASPKDKDLKLLDSETLVLEMVSNLVRPPFSPDPS